MSGKENKAIVRRFFEAFETGDLAALKTLLAPDLVSFLPGDSEPVGREPFLDIVQGWNAAFSELHFTLELQIAQDDLVANLITLRGIHDRGEFAGQPARGNAVAIKLITTERVRDGQITERRVIFEISDFIHQLNATPQSDSQ